jgi:hypothetical protein
MKITKARFRGIHASGQGTARPAFLAMSAISPREASCAAPAAPTTPAPPATGAPARPSRCARQRSAPQPRHAECGRRGLGLLAGLNVIPKCSFLSEYDGGAFHIESPPCCSDWTGGEVEDDIPVDRCRGSVPRFPLLEAADTPVGIRGRTQAKARSSQCSAHVSLGNETELILQESQGVPGFALPDPIGLAGLCAPAPLTNVALSDQVGASGPIVQ